MRILMGLAVAVFLMGGQAIAKTPDGETPAEEEVCAEEDGLCNAYCEAMDCDSKYPQASKTACTRVFELYTEHNNDSEPPCVKPGSDIECRCFTYKDLQVLSNHKYVCHYGDDYGAWIDVQYKDSNPIEYLAEVQEGSTPEDNVYYCGKMVSKVELDYYVIGSEEYERCYNMIYDTLTCTKGYF